MALSAKDTAAVKKAAAQGGLSSSQANTVVKTANSAGSSSATPSPATITKTNTSTPAPAPVSSSKQQIGSYQNQPIYAGSQDDVNAQVKAISTGLKATDPASNLPATSSALPGAQQAPTAGTTQQGLIQQIIKQQQDLQKQLGGFGSGSETFNNAQGAYQNAIAAQQKLKSDIAAQTGAIESQPIPLVFQQGREQALSRQYASQLDAGQQAINQSQTAMGLATAQQGQQQSALQNAAGINQNLLSASLPQVSQYGQTSFNPLTGQFAGGGGQELVQGWAQYLAQGGDPSQVPSTVSGNVQLWLQTLNAAKQMNPSFDVNTALGSAAGRQSNAGTGVTTPVQANQGIYNDALNTYYQLQNSVQNVDQFASLLTKTMQDGGINPFLAKYANQSLAQVRNQLSSAKQAEYDNTLATLRSRVSGLLAAGGAQVPTAITADAQKILDGTLPLASLEAVLNRISQEGNILLTNQAEMVNKSRSGTLGGSTSGGSSGGSGWF